jgi:hypothetical protein
VSAKITISCVCFTFRLKLFVDAFRAKLLEAVAARSRAARRAQIEMFGAEMALGLCGHRGNTSEGSRN